MIKLFVAGREIDTKEIIFPAGEKHVSVEKSCLNITDDVVFELRFQGSHDIVTLMMYCDIFQGYHKELVMKYVPFGRQDRAVNRGEANSLRAFAKFINSLKFDAVHVSDPHSDVVEALFDNVRIQTQLQCFNSIVLQHMHRLCSERVQYDLLVSPDIGASKKTSKISESLKIPFIQCYKKRDLQTGEILSTRILEDLPLDGKSCLIVDDICDGGRTFIEVAKSLKEAGAGRVDLYVTHGIFSKGMSVFDGLIDEVFCFNVMNNTVSFSKGRYQKEISNVVHI